MTNSRQQTEIEELNPEIDFTLEEELQSHTPLMIAAEKGEFQTVEKLIQSCVEVNAESLSKGTAVMFAAGGGHFEVVKYLVDHGADLEHKNSLGWNTLAFSACGDNLELTEWLVNDIKMSPNANEVNRALLFAALSKNINMLLFLFNQFSELAGDNEAIIGMNKNTCFDLDANHCLSWLNDARDILALESDSIEELNMRVKPWPVLNLMLNRLPHNKSLKKLTFCYVSEHHESITKLIPFLARSNLEELSFARDHTLTPCDTDLIFEALSSNQNSKLKKLNMSACQIVARGAKTLADFIEQSRTLESLNLERCKIAPEATSIILDAINKNPKALIELNLACNQTGIEGAKILAKLLSNPAVSLQSLNISSNHNLGEGILIIDALKDNKSVTQLEAANLYPKTEEAVIAIASMISKNNSIKYLNLNSNNFTDIHGEIIANALEVNRSIEKIDLSDNHEGGSFDIKTAVALGKVLTCNSTIKKIDLSNHTKLGKEMHHLASGIALNKTLIKLDLGHTYVNDEGLMAIIHALKSNYYLKNLCLSGQENNLKIDSFLERNRKLPKVKEAAIACIAFILGLRNGDLSFSFLAIQNFKDIFEEVYPYPEDGKKKIFANNVVSFFYNNLNKKPEAPVPNDNLELKIYKKIKFQ